MATLVFIYGWMGKGHFDGFDHLSVSWCRGVLAGIGGIYVPLFYFCSTSSWEFWNSSPGKLVEKEESTRNYDHKKSPKEKEVIHWKQQVSVWKRVAGRSGWTGGVHGTGAAQPTGSSQWKWVSIPLRYYYHPGLSRIIEKILNSARIIKAKGFLWRNHRFSQRTALHKTWLPIKPGRVLSDS